MSGWCLEGICGMSKWYVGCQDVSEEQVRTGKVRMGQVRTSEVKLGQVKSSLDRLSQVRKSGLVKSSHTGQVGNFLT